MTTTTRLTHRLELRQRMYVQSRTRRWALWVSLVLTTLVVVAAMALILYQFIQAAPDPAAVVDKVLDRLASSPMDTLINLLVPIAFGLHILYMRRAQQHERLILTPAGIAYRSPMPAGLQTLRPSWSLAWGQIRSATLKSMLPGGGPQTVVLELDGGTRKVKIFPYQWVDPEHDQPISPWKEMFTLRRAASEEAGAAIHESATLRYLAAAAPHLAPPPSAKLASAAFALEKNPRALTVVIAFFALVLYAFADAIIGQETYAGRAPFNAFAAAGGLAALVAALWLWRGKVPLAESLFVALLFGGALGAAGYPGALRVNALTDADGLRKYEYQLTREHDLEPLTPGLPTLAFPRYYDYWEQFKSGSRHAFELRKGGLGFYQLNMQPVNEALREFHSTRN